MLTGTEGRVAGRAARAVSVGCGQYQKPTPPRAIRPTAISAALWRGRMALLRVVSTFLPCRLSLGAPRPRKAHFLIYSNPMPGPEAMPEAEPANGRINKAPRARDIIAILWRWRLLGQPCQPPHQ